MDSLFEPAADAEAARMLLVDLARAGDRFDDPADAYRVLASVVDATRSLHRVLHNLALAHDRFADRATDPDGDRAHGRQLAETAARQLRGAAAQLDAAGRNTDAAWVANGQLVCPPATSPTLLRRAEKTPERSRPSHGPQLER
ncbi:hypothetical protein [Euzebya sp.]|uniref:hypothetical protein n=1 Tax=Euzebya sp. TaxID=1971409 RepID=UPI003519CE34